MMGVDDIIQSLRLHHSIIDHWPYEYVCAIELWQDFDDIRAAALTKIV